MNKTLTIIAVVTVFIIILILNAKYGCEEVDAKTSCNAPAQAYQYPLNK